jgi:hypothetical protein
MKSFVAAVQFCNQLRDAVCSREVGSLLTYLTGEVINTVM